MYLFVINKKSGNGNGYRTWIKIRAALDARLIRYRHVFTESAGQAEDVVAATLSELEHWLGVAVIGGDGTIHSVLLSPEGVRDPACRHSRRLGQRHGARLRHPA